MKPKKGQQCGDISQKVGKKRGYGRVEKGCWCPKREDRLGMMV